MNRSYEKGRINRYTRPQISPSLSHVTEKEEGRKKDWKGKSGIKGRIEFSPHALSLSDLLPLAGKPTFVFATFNEVNKYFATSVHVVMSVVGPRPETIKLLVVCGLVSEEPPVSIIRLCSEIADFRRIVGNHVQVTWWYKKDINLHLSENLKIHTVSFLLTLTVTGISQLK